MNIWYDVSDLTWWPFAHLTGIQRTTVGVLNGLVEHQAPVRLVHYDPSQNAFVPLSFTALPEGVQRHLDVRLKPEEAVTDVRKADRVDVAESATPQQAASEQPKRARKRRWLHRDRIFGQSLAAQDLRQAFRQFKSAARHLRRSFKRWGRVRLALTKDRIPAETRIEGRTEPFQAPAGLDRHPFASGDTLVSIGLSWPKEGHDRVVSSIRNQGVRLVRMIYDLIPTLKPQWVEPHHTRLFTLWARDILTRSDHVLTISQFSRLQIERYCAECRFPIPPLSVVRLGDVLASPTGDPASSPLPRFTPSRPFFVCVSSLDVRKNHRLLYEAWTLLAERYGHDCPDLLCIGLPHLHVTDILWAIRMDPAVNRFIHVLHGIRDSELEWYYQNCLATIYPSQYEGWGLPVGESLAHGRLCLASNATSIPEIGLDLPQYFAPHDVGALARLVERVIEEPAWVREREAKIRAAYRPTEWRETAKQVLDAIAGMDGCGAMHG